MMCIGRGVIFYKGGDYGERGGGGGGGEEREEGRWESGREESKKKTMRGGEKAW